MVGSPFSKLYRIIPAVTCCVVIGCSGYRPLEFPFEENERDFYGSITTQQHYIFSTALDVLEQEHRYHVAISKAADFIANKDQWILVKKLVPASGDFRIGIFFKSEDGSAWKALLVDSNTANLTEVDAKSAQVKIESIWNTAPTSMTSDSMDVSDPLVFYVSMGRGRAITKRFAVANPGFQKVTPNSHDKFQFDLQVDQTYLTLSKYAADLFFILTDQR
ncbi:MAG: hypothetical protein HY243_14470 [Proteobacteria bacterium]|nr:hypothetical protein [Pseudomonadota bacterium]